MCKVLFQLFVTIVVALIAGVVGKTSAGIREHSRSFLAVGRGRMQAPTGGSISDAAGHLQSSSQSHAIVALNEIAMKADLASCIQLKIIGQTRSKDLAAATSPLKAGLQAVQARRTALTKMREFVDGHNKLSIDINGHIVNADAGKSLVTQIAKLQLVDGSTMDIQTLANLRAFLNLLDAELQDPLAKKLQEAVDLVAKKQEEIGALFADPTKNAGTGEDGAGNMCVICDPNVKVTENLAAPPQNKNDEAQKSGYLPGTTSSAQKLGLEASQRFLMTDLVLEQKLFATLTSLEDDLLKKSAEVLNHKINGQDLPIEVLKTLAFLKDDATLPDVLKSEPHFMSSRAHLINAKNILMTVYNTDIKSIRYDEVVKVAGSIMNLRLTATAPVEFNTVFGAQLPSRVGNHWPTAAEIQQKK